MLEKVASILRLRAAHSSFGITPLLATFIDYRQYHSRMARMPSPPVEDQLGARYLAQVKSDGICIIENFWDEKKCRLARNEVDRLIETYPEHIHSNAKADRRIYGANNASILIAEFRDNPLLAEIASAYNQEPTRAAFTLAAKMPASQDNLGSGEGWHRDAPLRQFKAILYLSDVSEDNGPFQVLKDSHKFTQVMSDTWGGKLSYPQFRITEEQVGRIVSKDQSRLITYTAKAGTLILADVSSIHRGMPIRLGTRYALTNYYFPEGRIEQSLYEKFNVLPPPAAFSAQQVAA